MTAGFKARSFDELKYVRNYDGQVLSWMHAICCPLFMSALRGAGSGPARVCFQFSSTGMCRFGDQCRFLHEASAMLSHGTHGAGTGAPAATQSMGLAFGGQPSPQWLGAQFAAGSGVRGTPGQHHDQTYHMGRSSTHSVGAAGAGVPQGYGSRSQMPSMAGPFHAGNPQAFRGGPNWSGGRRAAGGWVSGHATGRSPGVQAQHSHATPGPGVNCPFGPLPLPHERQWAEASAATSSAGAASAQGVCMSEAHAAS